MEHIQDTMPAFAPKDITAKDSSAIVHVRSFILSQYTWKNLLGNFWVDCNFVAKSVLKLSISYVSIMRS